ncbi:BPI protein, partial [Eolophus roseicapillus]|nr:BPI protein [Eolophus roseicapilla]
PVELPVAQEPMLLVAVTDFVANSAAFAYFTAGALRRNISSATVLQRFPLQLKTKSFGIFTPQLQERFPDQPMELQVWARQQPLFSCHPDAVHGALFGSAEAFVLLPNGTRVPAFLLDIPCPLHPLGTGEPCPLHPLGAGSGVPGGAVAPVPGSGLPVPQVQRLETLLNLGLRLFGVPRANSE